MKIKGKFLTTGIGSLPYLDAGKSVKKIFDNFDIPFWPQLPKIRFEENMYIQNSSGTISLVTDKYKKTMYIDTADYSKIEKDLDNMYGENLDSVALNPDYAKGFYAFIKIAKQYKPKYVKGQITGPFSYGLTVVDNNKKSIIYDDTIRESFVIKRLAMQAEWQVDKLKDISKNVIIFMDEPYLVNFGSSFVNIQRQDIVSMLNRIIEKIHLKGAWAGIHCCGNTDWSILTDTEVDVINFDAYSYMDRLLLYSEDIKRFLKRGGYLAWGIVPTSDAVLKETGKSLFERLSLQIENLEKKSIDRDLIISNSILTPSCGMGTLSENLTEDIIAKLNKLSSLAKQIS